MTIEATVNGARLYYETLGDESAPALVSLHGGPGVGDCRDQVRDYGALQTSTGCSSTTPAAPGGPMTGRRTRTPSGWTTSTC